MSCTGTDATSGACGTTVSSTRCDLRGRVTQETQTVAGLAYVTSATYSALGQSLAWTNGAGVTTTRSYDPSSFRLFSLTFSGTGAPALSCGYTYDAAGNLQTLTENGVTTTFGYDHVDRLTSASGGFTASYSYAAVGYLLTNTEASATCTVTYDLTTQPTHALNSVDSTTYSYDAENRLSQVT